MYAYYRLFPLIISRKLLYSFRNARCFDFGNVSKYAFASFCVLLVHAFRNHLRKSNSSIRTRLDRCSFIEIHLLSAPACRIWPIFICSIWWDSKIFPPVPLNFVSHYFPVTWRELGKLPTLWPRLFVFLYFFSWHDYHLISVFR